MSKKTYEIVDLAVMALLAALLEGLNVFAFTQFGIVATYSISVAAVFGMIAIYRWNYAGLPVAVIGGLGGLLVRLMLGQTMTTGLWLAYTVGYLALAVCPLWFLKKDKGTINWTL